MSRFNSLKKLEIVDNTTRFTFTDINNSPTFIIKPANGENKSYFNEVLKMGRKTARSVQSGKEIDDTLLNENRNQDRVLYPKHVVIGWEGAIDDEGQEVEFSELSCSEYFEALPDWLFDKIRNYAAQGANFIEVEDVIKN